MAQILGSFWLRQTAMDDPSPAPVAAVHTVALVWPATFDGCGSFRAYRLQFESAGVVVHPVSLECLLDVEHGDLEIDAIASIGAALDAARCVAARRRIPYVLLDADGVGSIAELSGMSPVRRPVFDVRVSTWEPRIGLTSVEVTPIDSRSTRPAICLRGPLVVPRSGLRLGPVERSLLFIDQRAIRLPDTATVAVFRRDGWLVEYRSGGERDPSR